MTAAYADNQCKEAEEMVTYRFAADTHRPRQQVSAPLLVVNDGVWRSSMDLAELAQSIATVNDNGDATAADDEENEKAGSPLLPDHAGEVRAGLAALS